MKISKLISLMLVFVMLASVFSMVTVSAATTADLGFVVYDETGETEVTGELVAGRTYQIAVKLSNISDGKFAGAQFAAYYDKTVLQAVKADGSEAESYKDAFVAGSGLAASEYDGKLESMQTCFADAGEGKVIGLSYVVKKIGDEFFPGFTDKTNVELAKYRFKALKAGDAGLKITSKAEYSSALNLSIYATQSEKITINTVPSTISVRDLYIVSGEVAEINPVYAFASTDTAETVTAALPQTVAVTFENEEGTEFGRDCAITWAAPSDFDAAADKGFTFTGTVAVPSDLNWNGGELADVSAKIVPAGKEEVTFNQTKVTLPASGEIKTDAGYTLDDAKTDAGEFVATYKDNTVSTETVVWAADTEPAYDSTKAGTYVLKGAWSDVYGNSQEVSIEIKIVAAGADSIEIKAKKNGPSITTQTMYTTSELKLFAITYPDGVEDEVTWTSDKGNSYLTITKNRDGSVTLKSKAAIGKVKVTATTGSGKSATVVITIIEAQVDGGNSYYSAGSNLLAQAAAEAENQQNALVSQFIDIDGYEWAANAIEVLRSEGIVTGKTASEFVPGDYVTRAEFLALLVRLFDFQAGANVKTFTDVSAEDWYYDVVTIASSLGIAEGYEDGSFKPNALVSRQDMTVLAYRAMTVANVAPIVGVTRTFTDHNEISSYAVASVNYMTSIGAINGLDDGSFRPLDPANRAQASVVIYNIYAKMN